MADNQLKIRIQLPHSSEDTEQTERTPQYVPEPPEKEIDKSEYLLDWRKIIVALLLAGAILGWVGYKVNQWLNDVPSLKQNNGTQATAEKTTDAPSGTGDTTQSTESPAPANIDDVIQLSPNTNSVNQQQPADSANAPIPRPKPVLPQHQSQSSAISTPIYTAATVQHADVTRIQLTSAVIDREPIDTIEQVWLDNGESKRIYLFVQLQNRGGQEVSVHWYYNTQETATINLSIGNESWRTNASKLLTTRQLGKWHVTLVDQNGQLLAQKEFVVNERTV